VGPLEGCSRATKAQRCLVRSRTRLGLSSHEILNDAVSCNIGRRWRYRSRSVDSQSSRGSLRPQPCPPDLPRFTSIRYVVSAYLFDPTQRDLGKTSISNMEPRSQIPAYSLLETCAELAVSTIVRDMSNGCGDDSQYTSYACFCYESSAKFSSMIGAHVSSACNPKFPQQNSSAIEVFSSYCKQGAVAPTGMKLSNAGICSWTDVNRLGDRHCDFSRFVDVNSVAWHRTNLELRPVHSKPESNVDTSASTKEEDQRGSHCRGRHRTSSVDCARTRRRPVLETEEDE
jgi:hypothetical protein